MPAAIHAGHEQNRRRRGNRDVLREELAVARFDAGLQFGFAHEREAAVRVQIDDSPAGFDFIRRDESGRNGQITEIGGPGPADAFEAAALMQRVLEFFEPGAELAVCRIPARRIIPAPQFAEEIVGRGELRLVLPDFGFEPLLFAAQRVDFAEQGLLVDAFAETVVHLVEENHDGGFHHILAARVFPAPEPGGVDLVFEPADRDRGGDGMRRK